MHLAYQARRLARGRGPSNLDTLASNSATQSPVAQATWRSSAVQFRL